MKNTNNKPNLYMLRTAKDWSQQQVANNAGISRSYYSILEAYGRVPSVAVAQRLARVFDFNWHDFFQQDDQSI